MQDIAPNIINNRNETAKGNRNDFITSAAYDLGSPCTLLWLDGFISLRDNSNHYRIAHDARRTFMTLCEHRTVLPGRDETAQ